MVNLVKELSPVHYKIMRLYLSGLSQATIAEQVQMTPSRVCTVINSPIFKHEYEAKKEQLDDDAIKKQVNVENESLNQLRLQTRAAVKRLTQGMQSDNENIAIRSSESILDRTGLGKVTKSETTITGPMVQFNIEQIALIKQTMEMDR